MVLGVYLVFDYLDPFGYIGLGPLLWDPPQATLRAAGAVVGVGVSNFLQRHLEELRKAGSKGLEDYMRYVESSILYGT